jgi:ribosomal protein S18 acetylase RimI-like enzyme
MEPREVGGDMFQVRRAIPGDESIVRAVRLEAMAGAPEAFGSTYERELARTPADWQRWLSTGATFLLMDGDRASGIVAGLHDPSDSAIVHLMSMSVDPACRGGGAADALVASVLSWARAEGARAVRLSVIDANARALRCYERNGFRVTGRQFRRERDGAIELQMEHVFDSAGDSSAASKTRSGDRSSGDVPQPGG